MQELNVKICGLTNASDVSCAIANGAKFLGFVFFSKSPRNIEFSKLPNMRKAITDGVSTVAVVVDPDDVFLAKIVKELNPDYVQLHGGESVARVREIKTKFKVKIIKAFPIAEDTNFGVISSYEGDVDFFLFDSSDKTRGYHGGSGKVFNWQVLDDLNLTKKWFLSGGLNISNICNAIEVSKACYIDVSSGVEASRGEKSQAKIIELFKLLEQKYECLQSAK